MENKVTRLRELYSIVSKHSNYQILPDSLRVLCNASDFEIKSRFEKERLQFITSAIKFTYKKVLDIGGNTGFFSIELLNKFDLKIDYFEGNNAHAEFVRHAAQMLGIEARIKVHNQYFLFNDSETKDNLFDICLLLNVLHHFGDDYGDPNISMENAKIQMLNNLNYLSKKTAYLVFQMGYCWKGNRNMLLFKEGTKTEMIDFIKEGTKDFWHIEETGIAELPNQNVVYKSLNEHNIKRDDTLGEFLNRPLFILKSLKCKKNEY